MSKLYQDLLGLRPWLIVVFTIIFFVISWLLFWLAGEADLVTDLSTYVYFAATTASTVGYGDISPQTEAGRLIAAFWFFPGSLLIFSTALGRLAGGMVERIRRMADGLGNFENLAGATVIVGYNRDHTGVMINNLIAGKDGDDKIVLLTKSLEADMPDGVKVVRSDRLDALSSLRRAAIGHAAKVMVYADSDAETFNACLAIRELNETVHLAAFFEDRDTARRAAKLANLEAIVSNASEALVRAAQDPGAGQILMALSAANEGATIYSATVRADVGTAALRAGLDDCDATLVAVSQPNDSGYVFAPFPQTLGAQGVFYYLCKERLTAEMLQTRIGQADLRIQV